LITFNEMEIFKTRLDLFDSNVYGYHFPVPGEIVTKFVEGNDRRVICTVNDSVKFHCALMPHGKISYILANKLLRNKLQINYGDEVTIALKKDRSDYGFPMPESFQELLDQDQEGSQIFHSLTKGKQRSLIYLVLKVKNIDSQINKGLAILHHLRDTKGKLDYKSLNERIKEYNQNNNLR